MGCGGSKGVESEGAKPHQSFPGAHRGPPTDTLDCSRQMDGSMALEREASSAAFLSIHDEDDGLGPPPPPQLDLTIEDVSGLEFVGRGMFCACFKCHFREREAVVKIGRGDIVVAAEVVNKDLLSERDLLVRLSHPSICGLLGAGNDPAPFLVLERLQSETLAGFVGSESEYDPSIAANLRRKKLRKRLPLPSVYRMAAEMAEGLAYLHDLAVPGGFIVHRDFKPSNIGFALDGHVRIFDFGLAKLVPDRTAVNESFKMTAETGSMRYMAPEVAVEQPYNELVDVYSFALVFWEMMALRRPYSGMDEADFYTRVVRGGHRPNLEKNWPVEVGSVLTACWETDPAKRMNAAAAARAMRALSMRCGSPSRSSVRSSVSSVGGASSLSVSTNGFA